MAYVNPNFKTKKELKAAVLAGRKLDVVGGYPTPA